MQSSDKSRSFAKQDIDCARHINAGEISLCINQDKPSRLRLGAKVTYLPSLQKVWLFCCGEGAAVRDFSDPIGAACTRLGQLDVLFVIVPLHETPPLGPKLQLPLQVISQPLLKVKTLAALAACEQAIVASTRPTDCKNFMVIRERQELHCHSPRRSHRMRIRLSCFAKMLPGRLG
jgi:hypothetical protein